MPFKALTRNKIEEIIQLTDLLFPNGSDGSSSVKSGATVTAEDIQQNAIKHGKLQTGLETLTPDALQELVALMLVGRDDDGAVEPGEFEIMVQTGPKLSADYVSEKQDLARYLRKGLQLLPAS